MTISIPLFAGLCVLAGIGALVVVLAVMSIAASVSVTRQSRRDRPRVLPPPEPPGPTLSDRERAALEEIARGQDRDRGAR